MRSYAIQTGENYRLLDGTLKNLPRLAGTVFIQIGDVASKDALFGELTQPDGLLEGYSAEEAGYPHRFYLNAPQPIRDQQFQNPQLLDEVIQQLRAFDNISLANPVFINKEKSLAQCNPRRAHR